MMNRKAKYASIALLAFVMAGWYAGVPFKTTLDDEIQVKALPQYRGVSLVAPVKALDTAVWTSLHDIFANSISLMPYAFFYPDKPHVSYDSPRQWWGERSEGIISCILKAKKQQLYILLKPHLWIIHGTYTGDFGLETAADWQIWEESYLAYILHYARIAEDTGADMFCIGTELGRSVRERPVFWKNLIDSVRNIYSGPLIYAANWDDYSEFPFWNKLDAIGIDAYFPLCNSKTPDLKTMKAAWKKHLREIGKFSHTVARPVIFTEFGYRDADYAAHEPWTESSVVVNQMAQANAYEAFFQSVQGLDWYQGGFVWKWYSDDHHRRSGDRPDFSPQGKPAEKILQKWYQPLHPPQDKSGQ